MADSTEVIETKPLSSDNGKPAAGNPAGSFYESYPVSQGQNLIRVLDLEVVADDNDTQTLRAQLRVVDLTQDPDYTALSYVWGTVDPHEPKPSLSVHIRKS